MRDTWPRRRKAIQLERGKRRIMKWYLKSVSTLIFAFILLLVICFLLSCSPQKRLNRLVRNNPELLIKDTIRDTTFVNIPEVRTDTLLHTDSMRDTVYIDKDRLHIKTVYKNNMVYIEGKCDSIIKEVPYEVYVDRIIVQELTWWQKNKSWIIPILVLIVGGAIAKKFL